MEVNLNRAVRSLNHVDRQLRDMAKASLQKTGLEDRVELSGSKGLDKGTSAGLLGELQQNLKPLMDLIGDSSGRQKELDEMFADPRQVQAISARAQELLEGYFNVENTAGRIFDFAFSFFDGNQDRETFAREMQRNIHKGFALAERELGGLADISLATRDRIDEKIEDFIQPDEPADQNGDQNAA